MPKAFKYDGCPLSGKWFHSKNADGKIAHQGQVLAFVIGEFFLVQLCSWLDGRPTIQKLIPASDMVDYNFYETDEDMREAVLFKAADFAIG